MQKKRDLGPHINVPRTKRRGKGKEGRHWGRGWGKAYLQARQSFKETVAADPAPFVLIRSGLMVVLVSSASIQLASRVSLALPLSAPFCCCWDEDEDEEGDLVLSPAKMGLTQDWEGPIMSSRSPIKTLAIVEDLCV